MDAVNWQTCEAKIKAHKHPTFHKGHVHREGWDPTPWQVKDDLVLNNCRAVIKNEWANY